MFLTSLYAQESALSLSVSLGFRERLEDLGDPGQVVALLRVI